MKELAGNVVVSNQGQIPSLSADAGSPALEGVIRSTGVLGGVPFEVWDINETISQLAYLTHNHFRYYGKFPSTLAAGFLNRYAKKGMRLIDNYCGSGTTLVEAAIRGINSVGTDINPFAVLATKVKTCKYDIDLLQDEANRLTENLRRWSQPDTPAKQLKLFVEEVEIAPNIELPNDASLQKWFPKQAQQELALVRAAILQMPPSSVREFFLCAYFGIVRRVSVAYDGEVRPHVNPDKKPRDVIDAFSKKVFEMIARGRALNQLLEQHPKCTAKTIQADNHALKRSLGSRQKFDVSLSHPPYLNCFDYLPVYKLEFIWEQNVSGISEMGSYEELRKHEVRSWPATTEKARSDYYESQRVVYSELRSVMKDGGVIGVVIGDATVHKKLIRVHEELAKILGEVGFGVERVIYRTTHYGTGKYSYEHRADYHIDDSQKHWSNLDDDQGKRDALIIARAN
jgi:16S rRNA G966 N2-methylase RsmD